MEAIILMGIQAVGKSTFYKASFADTHVRINGDMLRGNKGCINDLVETCLRHGQPFVLDMMNHTLEHRQRYLPRAKEMGFLRIGYYFQSVVDEALERNRNPDRAEKGLPDGAIRGIARELVRPSYAEGFDRLYHVHIDVKRDGFQVDDWEDEGARR